MKTAILTPAYGRDYKAQKHVLEDWDANKDFKLQNFGGVYVNKQQIEDLKRDGFTQIQFRFSQQRKLFIIAI